MVSFILPGNSASSDYEVANSLRFDGASSAYLNRTHGSSGSTKTMTISFWVKKCEFATAPDTMADAQILFGGQQNSYPGFFIIFSHVGDFIWIRDASATNNIHLSVKSDFKFRDPSAWYHVVYEIDTTQGTASNRVKLYIMEFNKLSLLEKMLLAVLLIILYTLIKITIYNLMVMKHTT
mgnify:CR=1 FL=1